MFKKSKKSSTHCYRKYNFLNLTFFFANYLQNLIAIFLHFLTAIDILGKAPEHLTEKQTAQLEFIAKADKRLYCAYLLKEKLRLVFQCEDLATAKTELDGWIKWAQHCRIEVFVELQHKIRRHYDAILATMEHHLSNAVLEATNRKIKLSVYMAYGFRNIDNMIDMIMLRCSDIDVRLPWEYKSA